MQAELDMGDLAVQMGVPLPGFVVYRNSWVAAVDLQTRVSILGLPHMQPVIHMGDLLMLRLTSPEIKAVIAHELAHLRRGDCERSLIEALISIAPWPISWIYAWCKRRGELDADAIAARYAGAMLLASALKKMEEAPYVLDGGNLNAHHPSFAERHEQLTRLQWQYQ